MAEIKIEPSKVWEFFQKEKCRLDTFMQEIAENPASGTVVMLASTDGKPDIVVSIFDDDFYEEMCLDEKDCEETVKRIYDKYIFDAEASSKSIEYEEEEDDYSPEDIEIELREDELDRALYHFFDVVFEGDIGKFSEESENEMFKDCKEHFLEYIYLRWGVDFRRPMYLEDENGEITYEEYPMDCLLFEDADNPIYLAWED